MPNPDVVVFEDGGAPGALNPFSVTVMAVIVPVNVGNVIGEGYPLFAVTVVSALPVTEIPAEFVHVIVGLVPVHVVVAVAELAPSNKAA